MLVSARDSFFTPGRRLVPAGAILDDQHPLVLRHPHLFEPVVANVDPLIEQATRAPGELSTARRRVDAEVLDLEQLAEVEQPAASATKAEWVEYAGAQGIDTTGMTKADIIELVG